MSKSVNPDRRSIRLDGYDYTLPGAYFVTLCTWHQHCLFGEVIKGVMRLSHAGKIVEVEWQGLQRHYPHLQLGAYVVMPNHFHGILVIGDSVGATRTETILAVKKDDPRSNEAVERLDGSPVRMGPNGPLPGSIGAIIGQFKSRVTKRVWKLPGIDRQAIWQRNYYEHIIRNSVDWQRIVDYIQNNPAHWEQDRFRP